MSLFLRFSFNSYSQLSKLLSESRYQLFANFLQSSNSSITRIVSLFKKSIMFDGSSSISPKKRSRLFLFVSSELKRLFLDKLFNLSFISISNPACIISILFILSNVFCVWGSYSLIFSTTLSKNSNLIGNSLLTG